MHVNIGTAQFEYSNSEKRLGVHNDSKLGFENQINAKCGKARGKVSALGRVAFLIIDKRKLIMNVFFVSEFS